MKCLEIIKDDLIHNINTLKNHCMPATVIAVLKGNAYGIGMVQLADILIQNEITTFAVSEIDEAITLREAGFKNEIILLTPADDIEKAQLIAQNDIVATVASYDNAGLLDRIGTPINAHIKIDTGFGRYGFYPEELSDRLLQYKNLNFVGAFSHFSDSFGKKENYTKKQFDIFSKALERLKDLGIEPKTIHIANSCAAIRYDYTRLNAVRIGSAFLGRLPIANELGLKRIGILKCGVSAVRTIKKGSYIGYANTYKAKKDIKAAIIPVGYKDGYGVLKSNDTFRLFDIIRYMLADLKSFNKKLYVTINNKKYPLIGRISMHNIIVDVTDSDIKAGDIAYMECNPILLKSEIKREYI